MSGSVSTYPFLRRAELYISNVPEWRGGGAQAQMVKIIGDGSTNHLRIRFEVQKHILSTASPTRIYVYNLSAALRRTLQGLKYNAGAEIELKIGWENIPVAAIFSGTLLAAFSERQEADIVTTLISLAGYGGLTRSIISQTFNGGTSLKSIVSYLASQIPGVTLGQVSVPNVSIGTQGYSMHGAAKDNLDDLAKTYGFWWTIDKGVLNAVSDNTVLSGATPLISYKNGYLKRAEPLLVTFMQLQQGVMIQSLINHQVNVGGSVKLESQLNPQLNNTYQVHTMSASGDTHGNEWDMRLESLLFGEQYSAQMTE